MKTKIELDEQIKNITGKIHKEYPVLAKHITKMPKHNSKNDEIMIKELDDYYHSLEYLVYKYAMTQNTVLTKKDIEMPIFSEGSNDSSSENIYQHSKEEKDLNPEDISTKK